MRRNRVSSTNVAAIGYDSGSQTLEIEFLNGSIYQYFDVPQQIYDELMGANSQGIYLSANIKGVYRYSKI